MWFDTHAHLIDERFHADREDVLTRARNAGVTRIAEISTDPAEWDAAAALAASHAELCLTLGVHPHYAKDFDAPEARDRQRAVLERIRSAQPVAALGEMGLDYFRMETNGEWDDARLKKTQEALFRWQLELAREWNMPVVIHCRDAHSDTKRILSDYYPALGTKLECPKPVGVLHCFTGTWEDAQEYQTRGFLIGLDAPVTYPKSSELQEITRRLSLERIVLETDAPYLPPQSRRGKRNEPMFIPETGEKVAELKRTEPAAVAEKTTANAKRLFRIS